MFGLANFFAVAMILRETDYHSRFSNEATVVHEHRESAGGAHSLVKAAAALHVAV